MPSSRQVGTKTNKSTGVMKSTNTPQSQFSNLPFELNHIGSWVDNAMVEDMPLPEIANQMLQEDLMKETPVDDTVRGESGRLEHEAREHSLDEQAYWLRRYLAENSAEQTWSGMSDRRSGV
ncbi:hypothetical protein ABW19_dt0207329 [Dactylella cylindrospora]|nr:hypothetical protein ABW19_dt0207329 [Dactylella cylindrospora]